MYVLFLLPVILFIVLLIFLDSFKLIKINIIAVSSAWGLLSAWLALQTHTLLWDYIHISYTGYSKFVSPGIEEILKGVIFLLLIKKGKIGFMIDGAIYGFSAGAFFSVIENYMYFRDYPDLSPMVWVVRGFGTALMHGGCTAIILMFAMGSLNTRKNMLPGFLKGLLAAIIIHSLYNNIIHLISPTVSTIIIVFTLPVAIIIVFLRNELLLKKWLDVQLAEEVQLLKMIRSGRLSHTKTGEFIISLKSNFSGEVLLDMMNYISLYSELSLHAKKVMLLKESGFPVKPEEHILDKLKELKKLKRMIGQTGLLALSPVLRMSQKDVWKLNLLER
ncbi:MAG: PrsW family glutamic-type intramembrane protease [Bacteroidales bacterium]